MSFLIFICGAFGVLCVAIVILLFAGEILIEKDKIDATRAVAEWGRKNRK